MSDHTLVNQLNDWLMDQALDEPDIAAMFEGLCQRLNGLGVPIARGRLVWSTLHPLFRAETVLWGRSNGAALEQFDHQDRASSGWMRSPMHFMLQSGVSILRRRLSGPAKLLDFEVVEELSQAGFTDYLVITTELFPARDFRDPARRGIFVTWATDREEGFLDEHIAVLQRIQRRFAVACKTAIQARIAQNVVDTYLGRQAGGQVLRGLIRLGEVSEMNAVVWYSDLRNSTRLAETLPSADFLELLNAYFECAARPAIAAGGEILAFVGDAVLAIFPVSSEMELAELSGPIFAALGKSIEMCDAINNARRARGQEPINYGIGLNAGTVMFGNIGVPERLAFTAVGPTVIEVARIEKLTKTTGTRVLTTGALAATQPSLWRSIGPHCLEGVGHATEIFAFREERAKAAA